MAKINHIEKQEADRIYCEAIHRYDQERILQEGRFFARFDSRKISAGQEETRSSITICKRSITRKALVWLVVTGAYPNGGLREKKKGFGYHISNLVLSNPDKYDGPMPYKGQEVPPGIPLYIPNEKPERRQNGIGASGCRRSDDRYWAGSVQLELGEVWAVVDGIVAGLEDLPGWPERYGLKHMEENTNESND